MRCNNLVRRAGIALFAIVACADIGSVDATTSTATFTAQIVIQADCQVLSPTTLDFGTAGNLVANRDATSTFSVQCTNTTPYNIGLNQGSTLGGTVATRKMASGGATVDYRMYSDSNRSTIWGNTVGTDVIGSTGTGSTQSFTIYGRTPAQSAPAPGTYTDTVTITVNF